MCLTDIVATADGPPEYVEFKVPGGDYEGDVSAYIGALVQNDGLDLTMNNHAPLSSQFSVGSTPTSFIWPMAASGAVAVTHRAMNLSEWVTGWACW